MRLLSYVGLLVILTGCQSRLTPAPVEIWKPKPRVSRMHTQSFTPRVYTVRSGDTLYGLAWTYHLPAKRIIHDNHLKYPYRLFIGQKLRLSGKKQQSHPKHAVYKHKATAKATHWCMPVRGKKYTLRPHRLHGYPGVFYPVPKKYRVRATADGKVVYVGRGVRGYGQLVLLTHGKGQMSAYGFNQHVQVHMGQKVTSAQTIAYAGQGPDGQAGVYFELREGSHTLGYSKIKHLLKPC